MLKIGAIKSGANPVIGLVPGIVTKLGKDGHHTLLEDSSGEPSFYSNYDYTQAGAAVKSRQEILKESDVVLTTSDISENDLKALKEGAIVIGMFNPLVEKELVALLQKSKAKIFSLDRVPRSSIAQSMDILSSLASLSGYKAVISAADRYSGYYPMMTTAAGTVPPAKVLILGAGVAGLQAIATAKRLGAVVEAFDVRSAVKEEVQSLGAKFIEVEGSKEDKAAGGYAVEQSDDYLRRQAELIHDRATKSDVIITTANIPGKKAPVLLKKETVSLMKAGSVIIDMASASGGNCEVTQDGKEIMVNGVKIIGDSRLYYQLPREASRLYSTNLYNFLKFALKDGIEKLPMEHEILSQTLINKPN